MPSGVAGYPCTPASGNATATGIARLREAYEPAGRKLPLRPVPPKGSLGLAWFVLPAPNQGRPAVAVAFLRGFETPDIRQKGNAGQGVAPDAGDFDDDSVRYRVRHVTGGAQVDPLHTYASTGAA